MAGVSVSLCIAGNQASMIKKNTILTAFIVTIVALAGFSYEAYIQPGVDSDLESLAATGTPDAFGIETADASNEASSTTLAAANVPASPAVTRTARPAAGSQKIQQQPTDEGYSSSDSTYTIRVGQHVSMSGITVTPIDIAEDSRCPVDAQCAQAGTVRVDVQIEGGGLSTTQSVALGQTISSLGYTAELSGIQPERMTGQALSPSDYFLTFTVHKQTS